MLSSLASIDIQLAILQTGNGLAQSRNMLYSTNTFRGMAHSPTQFRIHKPDFNFTNSQIDPSDENARVQCVIAEVVPTWTPDLWASSSIAVAKSRLLKEREQLMLSLKDLQTEGYEQGKIAAYLSICQLTNQVDSFVEAQSPLNCKQQAAVDPQLRGKRDDSNTAGNITSVYNSSSLASFQSAKFETRRHNSGYIDDAPVHGNPGKWVTRDITWPRFVQPFSRQRSVIVTQAVIAKSLKGKHRIIGQVHLGGDRLINVEIRGDLGDPDVVFNPDIAPVGSAHPECELYVKVDKHS
jgi:hypothetical protein